MSYQLRILILYTRMQINTQTALSRAFAFFLIVFLYCWHVFGEAGTILGFLHNCSSWLLNARRALTSRWRVIGKWSSNGAQTAAVAPVWRRLLVCVLNKRHHFDWGGFSHFATGAVFFFFLLVYFLCACTSGQEKCFSYKVTCWYVC